MLVILTGATGFVGPELLAQRIARPSCRIDELLRDTQRR